jgi:hypothetical protein
VYGRNEHYEFALERRGDSPWAVAWQSSRRDEGTPVGSAHAYLGGMLHLPWSISAVPLGRLVDHPRFAIRRAQQGGRGMVRLDFEVAPAVDEEDDLQGLSGGYVVLDPARRWAVIEYRAHYGATMWSSANLAYGELGPPELRRVRFELRTAPTRANVFEIDVAGYDWAEAANSEFTLPAFGLPDYEDPAARRRWLRLVNLGVVFVLLGLILRRRRQQRSV